MVHENTKAWGTLGRLRARDKGPSVIERRGPSDNVELQGRQGELEGGGTAALGSLDQEATQPELEPERP